MLNFQMFSNEGLETRRRALLASEPPGHNTLICLNSKECTTCRAWRRWAMQLVQVDKEIQARQSK